MENDTSLAVQTNFKETITAGRAFFKRLAWEASTPLLNI